MYKLHATVCHINIQSMKCLQDWYNLFIFFVISWYISKELFVELDNVSVRSATNDYFHNLFENWLKQLTTIVHFY